MGIRSQNNPIAAYLDVFSNTGTDASYDVNAVQASGGSINGIIQSVLMFIEHMFLLLLVLLK